MKDIKGIALKKLNKLETHDRKICFQKHQTDVGEFLQNIIDNKPFGNRSCYLHIIHKRSLGEDERVSLVRQGEYENVEDTPVAFMWMQARLSKPEATPNTTLIKIKPGEEEIRIIWSLPEEHLWNLFQTGMFRDDLTSRSINMYKMNKRGLEALEEDDPKTKDEFIGLMNQFAKTPPQRKKLVRRIPIYAPRETAIPD